MMKRLKERYEAGQAVVLIAIAMVMVIAFLGLAIDGGGLFLLTQDAQNAADAAAMTAAYALCTDADSGTSDILQTIYRVAEDNGFINTGNVQVNPNVDKTAGTVEVEIVAEKPSYFIQIVYGGPLEVQADATGICNNPASTGIPDNSAVVTTEPDCTTFAQGDESLRLTGNGSMSTFAGGVFVNATGCTTVECGGNGDGAFGGFGIINRGAGESSCITTPEGGSIQHDQSSSLPVISQDPYGSLIAVPDCSALPARGSLSTGSNQPGTYSSFDVSPSATVMLESGVYCIQDDTARWQGTIDSAPEGVFLYFDPTAGANQIRGTSGPDVNLYAFNEANTPDTNPDKARYLDLLIYMPSTSGGNATGVQLRGTASLALDGTIYAPYQHCDLSGASTTNDVRGQLICATFDGTGNGGIDIFYEATGLFDFPPTIGLQN